MKTFSTYDKDTGYYTMALFEKGGPIICGKDLEKVKKDFNEALKLAFSIKNIKDNVMNIKKIYLDDERFPKGDGFIIIRSYNEFIKWIDDNGIPDYISFDHDIASYDNEGNEKRGIDAAKYIVEYCLDNNIKCPDFNVHSANPVGADNIEKYLSNFQSFQKNL